MQPQPPVLDIERESSFDELQVDRDGETVSKASASASDMELGKEGNLSKNIDSEGLRRKVDTDIDLPKPAVSNWTHERWHSVSDYRDGEGAEVVNYGPVGLPVFIFAVYVAILGGEDVDVFSMYTFRNLVVAFEPLVD